VTFLPAGARPSFFKRNSLTSIQSLASSSVQKTKDRTRSSEKTLPSDHERIAFVCFSRSLGGLELTTLRLAQAVTERGHFVLIVIPDLSPLQERATAAGLTVVPMEPRWKYGDVTTAVRLGKSLRKNRIEIVVLLQSKDLHVAALASMISKTTKLVFYQQMDSGYDKRDALHTWVFSKLSQWMSLTSSMRDKVLKFTRMPENNVNVLPLGIDLSQFDPAKYRKTEARRFFKLPGKKKLIGVLGRLDPQKGQEVFLRACSALVNRHPNIHLVVAGDETAGEPGYKHHLEELCETLHIEDRVSFLPFTDDVPRLMAALDILVLPSFSETYGLVLIEAMAMKCPVVATNAGGVPEIIENGKTGLLVPPHDVDTLAGAIHALLTDSGLRTRIIRSAHSSARSLFDFKLTVDSFLSTLNTL